MECIQVICPNQDMVELKRRQRKLVRQKQQAKLAHHPKQKKARAEAKAHRKKEVLRRKQKLLRSD